MPLRVWSGQGNDSFGKPWDCSYVPLDEGLLSNKNCPCGGYSFWDYVLESDAKEIADKLEIKLNPFQVFLDKKNSF